MKKNLILMFSVLITLNIVACQKDDYETHKSNGKLITQELQVKEFTSVVAEGKSNVILKQATKQKVTVTISENILNDIDLNVYNGTWKIDYKKDLIATLNKHEFTVVIESPNITKIQMENTGSLICDGVLQSAVLLVQHNSSGQMAINCKTNELTVNMDGSGKLSMTGETTDFIVTHNSSGEMDAFKLKSENCRITHDGSGDSKLFVTKKLNARIDGGGDIYFKGRPEITSSDDGGGNLIDSN